MTSEASPLLLARTGSVATLTFNRPAVLNALDQDGAERLLVAAREVAEDPAIRCVVLRGAGRAFMAGGDVATFHRAGQDAPQAIGRIIDPLHAALRLLCGMPKPFLVSVHGAVAGAGVSLLLAGDLAIAADNTVISLAYTRLGTNSDGGSSWALPRVVGLRKAMEIALLNEPMGAAEAARLSLVNRVVPAADLAAETDALARKLADGPTAAFGAMKRLLRDSFDRDFPGQLDAEGESFRRCAATADFREGVAAFMGKRPPRFGGGEGAC